MPTFKARIVYVCGTDWDWEFESPKIDVKMYESLERFKEEKTCWEECGIYELEISKPSSNNINISKVRCVRKPDFRGEIED